MATLESKILKQILGLQQEVLYNIFVDIHKAYSALDWGRALVILERYRVGLQVCQILNRYWDWVIMAVRESGYYGDLFQGYRGVSQWQSIYPRI